MFTLRFFQILLPVPTAACDNAASGPLSLDLRMPIIVAVTLVVACHLRFAFENC